MKYCYPYLAIVIVLKLPVITFPIVLFLKENTFQVIMLLEKIAMFFNLEITHVLQEKISLRILCSWESEELYICE